MNRTETLNTALAAVEQRGQSYGKPENNFARIARRWNIHLFNRYGLEPKLDAIDVAAMMADMKLARLEESPGHVDSWVDLAGYAACGAEVSAAPREDREPQRIPWEYQGDQGRPFVEDDPRDDHLYVDGRRVA